MSSLNPQQLKLYVEKYRINGIIMTNACCLSKIIAEVDELGKSLQFVFISGGTFPPVFLEKSRKKYGIIFASLWGSTETSGVFGFAINAPVESCGKRLPRINVKTVDVVTGGELAANCEGELCVISIPYLFTVHIKSISIQRVSQGWERKNEIER